MPGIPTLAMVIGQAPAATLVRRLIGRGRLPHALLYEGLPGCGRRTMALATARALLCGSRVEGDGCGICRSCRLADAGTHPDLTILAHDSERDDLPVDTVRRDVVEAAQQSPLLGHGRVFIIPGIERLHQAAANALLKVLEEPALGTTLIMTCASSSAVLATIISRVQRFRLRSLSRSEIAAILVAGGADPVQAAERAATAHGSHRGLQQVEDKVIPLDDLVRLSRGEFHSGLVSRVLAALPTVEQALPDAEEGGGEPRSLAALQRHVMGRWLGRLIQTLRPELGGPDALRTAEAIERILGLQRELDRNQHPRLVIEALGLAQRF